MKNYYIVFYKDGIRKTYQIPAKTEQDALVRLGQIYGDKDGRDDVVIEVLKISLSDKILYEGVVA